MIVSSVADVVSATDVKGYEGLPLMEDGLSVEQIAKELTKSVKWVRERLKALAADGQLEIGKKRMKDLLGRTIWVPVYKTAQPMESTKKRGK